MTGHGGLLFSFGGQSRFIQSIGRLSTRPPLQHIMLAGGLRLLVRTVDGNTVREVSISAPAKLPPPIDGSPRRHPPPRRHPVPPGSAQWDGQVVKCSDHRTSRRHLLMSQVRVASGRVAASVSHMLRVQRSTSYVRKDTFVYEAWGLRKLSPMLSGLLDHALSWMWKSLAGHSYGHLPTVVCGTTLISWCP